MKKISCLFLTFLAVLVFSACNQSEALPEITGTPDFPAEETFPTVTEAEHSPLYIPGLDAESVILYFNEVCMDAEIVHSGNASVLQRWEDPIFYYLHGSYTDEDWRVLDSFAQWLNTVQGFPGIQETQDPSNANLNIHFTTQEDMLSLMGEQFYDMDGAVTFWYDGNNRIYDGIICCRTDLNQTLRNSVLQEELYNGLGPIQDTILRPDSIIFGEYAEPQCLTQIDKLILTLLYHPELQPGMHTDEVASVIRNLYY